MIKTKLSVLIIAMFLAISALAEFSPHEVIPASKGKQEVYVMDAIIRGGDPMAVPVSLANIRWARKQDFERVVFDIEGNGIGWESRIPPYFQVGLNPNKGRLSLDIKGINNRRIVQADIERVLAKSALVKRAYFAPKLQGELASLELTTKSTVDVEAFYLLNPPRIVLDLRAKR
jgi:hypothetical protein